MKLFTANSETKYDALIQFMNSHNHLHYSVNRILITYEIYLLCKHPEKIRTKNNYLCGPTVFLTILMTTRPDLCIQQFVQLLSEGKTSWPLFLEGSTVSKTTDKTMIDIMLSAIRYSHNPIVGYSAGLFDKFRGYTEPYVLCRWLRQCGFTEVTEATVLTKSDGKEMPWYYRMLAGGAYEWGHKRFESNQESLKSAVKELSSNKVMIMLLTPEICGKFVEKNQADNNLILGSAINYYFDKNTASITEENEADNNHILDVTIDHYVVVNNLSLNFEKNTVSITIVDGGIFNAEIDMNEFLQNYRGYISAKPNPSYSLEHVTSSPALHTSSVKKLTYFRGLDKKNNDR
jgi:hypothetical protein